LDVIGGHKGWCREEWERWHVPSRKEKALAEAEALLGRIDVA
jgi:hypothetical protein